MNRPATQASGGATLGGSLRTLSPQVWREGLLALAMIAGLLGFAASMQERQRGDLPVQGVANREFSNQASLREAVAGFPKKWPPLYPMLLWSGERVGVKKAQVQLALFGVTLGLLWGVARRIVGTAGVAALTLLYATCHVHFVTLRQTTAEILVVPLCLGAILLLVRYAEQRSPARLVALALTCAALNVTRYFAGLFLGPVVAFHALWPRGDPWRRRFAHLVVLGVIAIAPLGAWLAESARETGHLTGMDRFGERPLPASARRWRETISFSWNLRFAAKTLVVDFFSPTAYASHVVVDNHYDYGLPEVGLGVLALAAAGAGGLALRAGVRAGRISWPSVRAGLASSPGLLVGQLLVFYYVLLIAVWTLANNDPLYTRFLYPSYVLLVLATFYAHDRVRVHGALWQRLPFWLLYAGTLVVQLVRDARAVALPLR